MPVGRAVEHAAEEQGVPVVKYIENYVLKINIEQGVVMADDENANNDLSAVNIESKSGALRGADKGISENQ